MLERLFPQQADDKLFVEDVFSTYLYTGNGTSQTINNGIDLAGKGGLIWSKGRSGTSGAQRHNLFDTARGKGSFLSSNSSNEQFTFTSDTQDLTSFNSNGFSVGIPYNANVNQSSTDYATWTFRKAPNFFDVVTYTGNGSTQTIAHSLGVAPGFILVKPLAAGEWHGYHRSLGATKDIQLQYDSSAFTFTCWDNTEPTSTNFTVKTNINSSGQTYVAYLFAHDTSSTGLIQCGSFTTDGSGYSGNVELGWEPQWVLIKSEATSPWLLVDNMRGWINNGVDTSDDKNLRANVVDAEATNAIGFPYATGFNAGYRGSAGQKWVYIAIRRGPMRTPTLGTSVYTTILQSPQSPNTLRTIGFPADFIIGAFRTLSINRLENTKLTGFANASGGSVNTPGMFTNTTGAESNQYPLFYDVWNTTARDGDYIYFSNGVNWVFRRAPGFFDVVCYTGTGAATTFNHNLGVAPELMIVKRRNNVRNWAVYASSVGANKFLKLNLPNTPETDTSVWNNTAPTSTVFSVGTSADGNGSGDTYVAYLFASAPGVSKVGSYTGNGSSQTINCAFTTGSRFVMIKRTDSTGDWYVWDSARGIVAGNDPYLALNDTTVEVTSDDSVDADSTGFIVNQVAASNINVSAATYIYLAIA